MNDIEKYRGLIIRVAKNYASGKISMEDLIQEGFMAILLAKKHYSKAHNTSFETYAFYWIKKRILAYVKKELNNETEQINEKNFELINRDDTKNEEISLPKYLPKLEQKIIEMLYKEELSLSEIAKKMNINREKVRSIKEKALRRLRSLNYDPNEL